MAIICNNCSAKVQENAKFCAVCGKILAQQPQYSPQQPAYRPMQQQYTPQQPAYRPPQQQYSPQQPAYRPPQQPQYAPQQPAYRPPQQQYAPQQPAYKPPQQQQAHGGGVKDKQTVLYQAPGALNRPDRPWVATVEGDSIVARWKWMDATFFSAREVSDETRQYTFTVTLTNKGTWKELDKTQNKSTGVKMSGGKMSFGSSSSSFSGKTSQKSFQFGAGKNNQTGEAGLVSFKFSTAAVKQPIRDYLTACGWRKA